MKNILVSTYGTTWHLMTELLGLMNPDDLPFYTTHPGVADIQSLRKEYSLDAISEIWMITTASVSAQEAYKQYSSWHKKKFSQISVHAIWSSELSDLRTREDCRCMRDLIFRTVLAAHGAAAGGKVILSMVGGFKTMVEATEGDPWGRRAMNVDQDL